jgi:hypothetical protein
MSTWGTILLAAVVAGLVGTLAGMFASRRSIRRHIDRTDAVTRPSLAEAAWRGGDAGGAAPPAAGSYTEAPDSGAPPPLVPTRARRTAPAVARRPSQPRQTNGTPAASRSGPPPLPRTPVLAAADADVHLPRLRVIRATGDTTRVLHDDEGLSIGPGHADVVVPELAVELLLGRSGIVWTIQTAGRVDPTVMLDGVPLTSVAIPWTSDRRLTAGALTLALENVPPPEPSFAEPATHISGELAGIYAARASAYGLAIGLSDGLDAATLATVALAAFDQRMLDPARGAALAALNVTLAVRDAKRDSPDGVSAKPPQVAMLGIDAHGDLRAAANFAVSVWGITETQTVLLSSVQPEKVAALEVGPLDLRASVPLGERPVLLLTAAIPQEPLRRYLAGVTTLTADPGQLVRAVAGLSPSGGVGAAAAVLSGALHGSVTGAPLSRWGQRRRSG